ncbi:UNVERIFIED_CONTAM: hypothetical protein Sindi_3092800, partial [Sesamum indicum]
AEHSKGLCGTLNVLVKFSSLLGIRGPATLGTYTDTDGLVCLAGFVNGQSLIEWPKLMQPVHFGGNPFIFDIDFAWHDAYKSEVQSRCMLSLWASGYNSFPTPPRHCAQSLRSPQLSPERCLSLIQTGTCVCFNFRIAIPGSHFLKDDRLSLK